MVNSDTIPAPIRADPPPENNTVVLDHIVRRERLGRLIQWHVRAARGFSFSPPVTSMLAARSCPDNQTD